MTEDLRKVVGQRLKLLRQEKQLTQEQMSEKLNISTSAYCKIEYGDTDLTLSRLNQIAVTLEMSAIELFSKIDGDDCPIKNYYSVAGNVVGNVVGAQVAKGSCTVKMDSNEDLRELVKANSRLIDLLSRQVEALEAKLQNR